MSARVWWPLFPLLFLIVLGSLSTAAIRAQRGKISSTGKGTILLALLFYILTFALGRWRWLHMPVSNIAEAFMVFNIVFFFKNSPKELAWLNVVALVAIASDFALHYILK